MQGNVRFYAVFRDNKKKGFTLSRMLKILTISIYLCYFNDLGTVNALLDAVVLANELFEIMDDPTPKRIKHAFKEYYTDRYNQVKIDFESSQRATAIIAGQVNWRYINKRSIFNVAFYLTNLSLYLITKKTK
jgi:hypothetical protein